MLKTQEGTLKLSEAQAKITRDKHRFRVLCCGRRFGKTTLAIEEMKACAALRESRVCYIAPTFQQARDIAWAQLKNDCKDAALNINESRLEITLANVHGTSSLIVLRGWEAVETLRGQQFDLVILDEVASMRNFWAHWQEIVRPTLTDTKGEALFISTPKGFNHFYDLYNLQETDKDYASYHYSTYDNPHIPREEVDKAKSELSYERFEQEYMASFKKTEGLVYKEFDRAQHLYTEYPQGTGIVERIAGVDFGFTNPCAIPTIEIDRTDTWWISGEYYQTGKTDAQVAEYVSAQRFNAVYPDPEAPAAIVEMRKRGVNVRDVVKGHDSIKNGIDAVRERMKAGKLRIHASCVNTILELETYSYPDKKDLHNENEKPIDEDNHMMDALRYPVMMRARRNAQANVHYADSAMPRSNLPHMQGYGAPPVMQSDNRPRVAYTHVPRL